jgi:[protein-PII] uridylyltransferase
MTADDHEWVFSFRARDQKGLLLSAIQTLHEEEMEIIWAKVHTWGRQIDDVFGLIPKPGLTAQEQLTRLKSMLERRELEIL